MNEATIRVSLSDSSKGVDGVMTAPVESSKALTTKLSQRESDMQFRTSLEETRERLKQSDLVDKGSSSSSSSSKGGGGGG